MNNIKIIFAQSLNGVIGNEGGLPWHLPDDLKEFKEKTIGHTVAMGRKTWESLPAKMRPLPNRINIVFTKRIFDNDARYVFDDIENLLVLNIPKEYFEICAQSPKNNDIWVIGGKSIYELALPHATELHITTVMINVEGDTLAPDINYDEFDLIYLSKIKYDSKTSIPYYVITFKRKI
jgi:dihydrofolate reductase